MNRVLILLLVSLFIATALIANPLWWRLPDVAPVSNAPFAYSHHYWMEEGDYVPEQEYVKTRRLEAFYNGSVLHFQAWKNECELTFGGLNQDGWEHRVWQHDNGNVEWDIILDSIPDNSVFTYPMQYKNLRFYYQPEPEPDKKDCTAPDSVIGSYALYHGQGKMNNIRYHFSDGVTVVQDYMASKFCHIYRSRAWDSSGDTIWCDLSFDTVSCSMSISVPRSFLNYAQYPIVVDPNIGAQNNGGTANTSAGTYGTTNQDIDSLCEFIGGTNDTAIISYSAYLAVSFGTGSIELCGYKYNAGTDVPTDKIGSSIRTPNVTSTTPAWHTTTPLVNYGPLTYYSRVTTAAGEKLGISFKTYYDVTTNVSNDQEANSNFEDPWVVHGTQSVVNQKKKYSWYMTVDAYSAGGNTGQFIMMTGG